MLNRVDGRDIIMKFILRTFEENQVSKLKTNRKNNNIPQGRFQFFNQIKLQVELKLF